MIIARYLFLLLFFTVAFANDADTSKSAMAERIAPIGKVAIAGASASSTAVVAPVLTLIEQLKIGKSIYQRRCSFCHATGSAGAPKITDHKQWQTRYEQGFAVLVTHVTKGYRMMPPKGTCQSCSEQDLAAAVRYMLDLANVKAEKSVPSSD